ncbi:universal stress protein [Halomonas campisalis]|uniref:Universal stress protein n=1 Tax=Billgrantia campisalis TaxID=74661 RepID=A0ABS9P7N9_9GAMM|nr:universal stress protein [Halomonas campisalis]MCG6657800.1 universal stress protein [Halomonas campisalis]MDR5864728.1 universal stress protein [Halomonas campisalis]
MFKHIVVAVDFSSAWPLLQARLKTLTAWGAERVTLIHVLSTRYPATPEETHRPHYEAKLAELAGDLAAPGLTIDHEVRSGEPGAVLTEAASELDADLLLMGCRGHSRLHEFFLGSTALDAARLTQQPLWLEPVAEALVGADSRLVMLATDGSEAVAGAEALAVRLAPHFRRRLALTVTCASDGCDREIADAQHHLDAIAERTEGLETRVLDGDPRHAIVEEARGEQADLIVMGKRGRNRIQEFLLGSTAEAIARDAHCPVLVVPGEAS